MILTACPGGPIVGTATIPGDKSCSHRALILGAMADGDTRIRGLLDSDDTAATLAAVEALGATVRREGEVTVVTGGRWRSPSAEIDCGNSGTLARLLLGAIAGRPGVEARLVGDRSLSGRPMERLVAPLRRMGADIDGGDRLPLIVRGAALGGIAHVNLPASAQVKSALLLAGLGTAAPVAIDEPLPSRDHGERMLAEFGVTVERDGEALRLGAYRDLRPADIRIAGDPSSAAFPLLAAAIVPGSAVTVRGLLVNPLRTGLYETLERMGASVALAGERVESGEIVAELSIAHAPLRPCQVEPEQIPAMIDEVPALAVACALADGESVIAGLDELRHKESDRLGAIVAGLVACGVHAAADGDALRVFGRGRVRGGATISTAGDHRIAMAFLTLGLAAEQPIAIDQGEMIATSFPGYVEVMTGLGARIA